MVADDSPLPVRSYTPLDSTSEPPSAVPPPAFANRFPAQTNNSVPLKTILPPSLSTVTGKLARLPRADVKPLECWIGLGFTVAEPLATSKVALVPETSITAALATAMLPARRIVPPAHTLPVRRPNGSGANTVVPAADRSAPGPR